jgi:glycosyltransferase involved in cell wall biosynthesis
MNKPPTVSVVIATYNYAHYLPGAIESALGQTFQDFEIIIVDDGSTDNTPETVAPFLSDRRIHYHRTENRGQPAAENEAIRLATAPWIAFLDADDEWLPTKIERQIRVAEQTPRVGVVYARRMVIDAEGNERDDRELTPYRGDVLEQIFLNNFVCFSSSMVHRDVLSEVGTFDERRRQASDYDLWIRIARFYHFDYVNEPLVKYRVGHGSLRARADLQLDSALAIMADFLEIHGGKSYLKPRVLRLAWAETYFHKALIQRPRSRWIAAGTLLRAISCKPTYWPAWKALLTLPLSPASRQMLRRFLTPAEDAPDRLLVAASGTGRLPVEGQRR